MKLIVITFLATTAVAEKLQSNYLPPLSAKTAGGSGSFLSAPRSRPFGPAPAFTPSGIATSYAAPPSGPAHAGLYSAPRTYPSGIPSAILRFNNENNGDGTYRYEYQTENKISQQEEGHLQNVGSNQESAVVHGSYSYEAPDGHTITVNYVADENGFRAAGDHIPTPPPIPAAIQKALEFNAAAAKTTGYSSSSSAITGTTTSGFERPQIGRQYLAPASQPASGYRY